MVCPFQSGMQMQMESLFFMRTFFPVLMFLCFLSSTFSSVCDVDVLRQVTERVHRVRQF